VEGAGTWWALQAWGGRAAGRVVEVTFLVSVLSLVPSAILLLAFLGGRLTRRGRMSVASVLVPFVVALSGFAGVELAGRVRNAAFDQFARRGASLVDALYAFEREHGRFPAELSELVPGQLSEVPRTGLGAYPAYRYYTNVGYPVTSLRDNPWALMVEVPWFQTQERLVFLPNGDYHASSLGGGRLFPVRDWVHTMEQ
jgi:hypothetical protein